MKSLVNVLKTSFSIVGTVIGAGFISGREILTFFYGTDIFISIVFLFLMFFAAFSIFLSVKNLPKSKILSIFIPVLLVGNLILMSAMTSAIDEIVETSFFIPKEFPFVSIIILIISYFVLKNGIEGFKSANAFLVPIILIFLLLTLLFKSNPTYDKTLSIKPLNLISYVGINTFMSSLVFVDLGKKLSVKQIIISAFFASLILCVLIVYIYCAIIGEGKSVHDLAVPIMIFLADSIVLRIIFAVVMLFAVMTTLFASHYPLYDFSLKFKPKKTANALILIGAFAISRLGFYNIINYLYPLLGYVGAVYILIISILSIFSQARKQKDTFPMQERIK